MIHSSWERTPLDIFEDANLIASNSGRPTLMTKDLNLARFLQDKQKNKKLRPLTIHEQEFEEHKEKSKAKKELAGSKL